MSEPAAPYTPAPGASTFTDGDGNAWKLRLTYGLACEVKRETGMDLGRTTRNDEWVELLFGDAGKLVGVLWVMCEGQAKERGVTPERFGYLFDGPVLEAAGVALANAVADFFPRSAVARAIREGMARVMTAADERAVAEVRRLTESTVSPSAPSSPESAGSTPAG